MVDSDVPAVPAEIAKRGVLASDALVQVLEEHADMALAEQEGADAALCTGVLREIIEAGPVEVVKPDGTVLQSRSEQLAALQELRRWHVGSRSQRHRRRLVKERDSGSADAADKLLDRGRELIRDRRDG